MFERMFGWLRGLFGPPALPVIEVSALPSSSLRHAYDDGTKFAGGFGATEILTTDYWTLRARSSQLFETNLYARGVIRRLITNEINTGLHLEAIPEESVLGVEDDGLADWAEDIENRFKLWGQNPRLCDYAERSTFGQVQAAARMESLIAGDVLVVIRQDRATRLPQIQLIRGESVQTPLQAPRAGNRIKHGVEIDERGRHVAFWVRQQDGTSKRLSAFGTRSGRRVAWLMYGTEKRLDDVRGKPILSLVLQSLREIDRYRDSVQRKAVINSMLAMFISKTEAKSGSRPMASGAVRFDDVVAEAGSASSRTFSVAEHIPGLILDELQQGETPHAFPSQGTDEKLGTFEEAIIQAVAWGMEIPPEILRLSFSSNYSASQAANNEFKIYLNKVRTFFGEGFCHPIYEDWLIANALSKSISAPRLLEAWRDPLLHDVLGAWIASDWSGHIKPSVDIVKQARGYKMLVDEGFMTRDRASRELTGTKFSKNVKKLARENEALTEALAPLASAGPEVDVPDDDDREDEDEDENEKAA